MARARHAHRDRHLVPAVGDADHVNTIAGIRHLSPLLLLAARSFGARPHDLLWKVALPASVPMIAAGLRLGVGRALTGVVIAELFVPSGGLGSSIAYNAGLLRTTDMLASLAVIVVIGVICTQTLSALEAKLSSWRAGPGSTAHESLSEPWRSR